MRVGGGGGGGGDEGGGGCRWGWGLGVGGGDGDGVWFLGGAVGMCKGGCDLVEGCMVVGLRFWNTCTHCIRPVPSHSNDETNNGNTRFQQPTMKLTWLHIHHRCPNSFMDQ